MRCLRSLLNSGFGRGDKADLRCFRDNCVAKRSANVCQSKANLAKESARDIARDNAADIIEIGYRSRGNVAKHRSRGNDPSNVLFLSFLSFEIRDAFIRQIEGMA